MKQVSTKQRVEALFKTVSGELTLNKIQVIDYILRTNS